MKDTLLNETVSGDKNSGALNLENSSKFSIQANVGAGMTAGNFKLQVSNDGVTYTDISGSTKAVTGATTLFWDAVDQAYEYVRVDISSVTGSASVEIISKKKM